VKHQLGLEHSKQNNSAVAFIRKYCLYAVHQALRQGWGTCGPREHLL